MKDPRVRRIAADPYALVPGGRGGRDGADQRFVRFDADTGRWTAPFMMAAINTRVVRRSNALLGYAYGEDFRYSEAMSFAPGPKGFVTATAATAAMGGFLAAFAAKPTRRLLQRTVLPLPGEGPSREARESGFFTSRLYGTAAAERGLVKLVATVKGTRDPGYGETAKMIAEAALTLVDGSAAGREGGILTPASCLGMPLVERLRRAGMTFEVEERA
jgi:short subunit dehydrogenase-like uncharacterized protein